jgi:hypothetical protein
MNAVLKRNSEELLKKAVEQFEQTGAPQRLFAGFSYQAGTWQQLRWVVVKCEANAQGTNRRREADPLGEGHACTWRMRLIKVAARIEVTARRVRVLLSGS